MLHVRSSLLSSTYTSLWLQQELTEDTFSNQLYNVIITPISHFLKIQFFLFFCHIAHLCSNISYHISGRSKDVFLHVERRRSKKEKKRKEKESSKIFKSSKSDGNSNRQMSCLAAFFQSSSSSFLFFFIRYHSNRLMVLQRRKIVEGRKEDAVSRVWVWLHEVLKGNKARADSSERRFASARLIFKRRTRNWRLFLKEWDVNHLILFFKLFRLIM